MKGTMSIEEYLEGIDQMSPKDVLSHLDFLQGAGQLSHPSSTTLDGVRAELDRLSKFVDIFDSAGGPMSKDRQRTASVYRAGFVAMCCELLAMSEE